MNARAMGITVAGAAIAGGIVLLLRRRRTTRQVRFIIP